MSERRHDMTQRRVLYDVPGSAHVRIVSAEYTARDGAVRTMNVYYPPKTTCSAAPVVLLVTGLSDIGAQQVLGCRISEMESFRSWARLVAASHLIAVTYTTGGDPSADTRAVVEHLRAHGPGLGLDATRIALWACSSHVPNALGQLIEAPDSATCAVLCYGFMLDLDGATGVAEAQRAWRFANPAAGKGVDDLPADVPLFIVRAGRDVTVHVNESIDQFVGHALRHNRPVTVVNHHTAPHAFDLEDGSAATREVIDQMLGFLCAQLKPSSHRHA